MKKLLITTDCFLPRWDGIARFLEEIIPKLKERYSITVIAPDYKGTYKKPDYIEIIRMPLRSMQISDIQISKVNKKILKEHVKNCDLVLNQTIGPIGMASIKEAKKHKKSIIHYVHSIDWELFTKSIKHFKFLVNFITKRAVKKFYNKCDLLLVPSDEVKIILRKNKIHTTGRVVNLGTDIHRFHPPKDKKRAKELVGIDPKNKVIGFSGRVGREKNLITLYRAFRKLEKKFSDIKLLIVGKGVKDEEKFFSDDKNIILTGSVNNPVPYLQAMDIYVLPSLTETSSLSTMEAMACELAVVTTPVGYVKEYIEEKENGMLFPFKNSMVLAMKLEILLNDDNLRITLGKNARKTIEKDFRWEKTAEKIVKALERF